MSIYETAKERIQSKEFHKTLEELYGSNAAGMERERYLGLIDKFEAEAQNGAFRDEKESSELRVYSAPGRTELGGNHTDHNHGRVLCAAVDLDMIACVRPTSGKTVRIVSEGWKDNVIVDLSKLEPVETEKGKTEALVRGIAAALKERGVEPHGFDVYTRSRVLPGSGLSSSAAIEVLLGEILADLAGTGLDPVEDAKIGQYAENRYFGKPCGLMDQTGCAVGGVISIDFANPAKPKVHKVDFNLDSEGYVFAIVNTGGSHADLTADYAAIPAEMFSVARLLGAESLRDIAPGDLIIRGPEIRAACGDRALLRAFHFAAENERVAEMEEALARGKFKDYLKLVKKSGKSSWELLQNLYPTKAPQEQGLCVGLAVTQNYLGKRGVSRLQGGGFAGTFQAYMPRELYDGWKILMERYFGQGAVMPVRFRSRGVARLF